MRLWDITAIKVTMKTTIRLTALLFAVTIISVSCNSNQPDNPYVPNGNTSGNNSGSTQSVETMVKNNVIATVIYSDFSWEITIRTALQNVYPNKTIRYGFEYGYGSYKFQPYVETFRDDTRAAFYKYRYYKSGNQEIYSLRLPLYVDSPYGNQQLYWYSYIDIKESITGSYSMSDSEVKSLYNSCYKSLKDSENAALNSYQGRIFVEVGGQRYYVREYNRYDHN